MPYSTDDLGTEQNPKTSLFARGCYPVVHICKKTQIYHQLNNCRLLLDAHVKIANLASSAFIFCSYNSHLRKKFPVLMFQCEAINVKLSESSTWIGFTFCPRFLWAPWEWNHPVIIKLVKVAPHSSKRLMVGLYISFVSGLLIDPSQKLTNNSCGSSRIFMPWFNTIIPGRKQSQTKVYGEICTSHHSASLSPSPSDVARSHPNPEMLIFASAIDQTW